MNNIAIWGIGPTGEKIYKKIATRENVLCFVDNNKSLSGKYYDGKLIVTPEEIYKMINTGSIDSIVLGTSPNNYDDVIWQILTEIKEFSEIYYVKEIGKSNELIKYTDRDLGYLEFDVARKCNLNCRGCLRYSNITKDSNAYNLENLERDLRCLKKLFNNIAFIRLLGGEPLLCENLYEYIDMIFLYFPNTQVDILSNGILVKKMKPLLIDSIKKHEVRLSISIYKATEKYTNEIEKFCSTEGIEFSTYVNKEKFFKQLNMRGDSNGAEVVKNCVCSRATIINNGVINRCCQPTFTYELNKKFQTKFPENIGINIYEEGITYKEVKEFVRSNTLFCRYCTTPEEYIWNNGKIGIELSDWVVK